MKTLVSVFFPLLLAAALHAQQPLHFAPAFRNYTTDQGLPDNWVYDIYQDKTGYLWIATNHGVCRFDGYTFVQFPDTLNANLTSVMSGAITEDELGRIWYVDFQARVFYIENGVIYPYRYNHVLEKIKSRVNYFHGLIVGENGKELWLVCRFNGGVVHLWGEGQYERILPTNRQVALQVFEKNGRWKACQYEGMRFGPFPGFLQVDFQGDGGLRQIDSLPCPGIRNTSNKFTEKLSDNRWFFLHNGYLYLLEKDRLIWMRRYDKIPNAVLEEPDGALLIGHIQNGGLDRYRSVEALRAGNMESSYLQGISVSRIARDREGGYWIGTQQHGLFYCPDWNSGTQAQSPFLQGENVMAVVAGENRLYAGLGNGRIFEMEPAKQQITDISPPGVSFVAGLFYHHPTSTLGVAGTSLHFYRRGQWQIPKAGLPNHTATIFGGANFLSPASQPGQWLVASFAALSRLDARQGILLDCSNCVGDTYQRKYAASFRVVYQARDGRVWTSTAEGLFEWKGSIQMARPERQHPAFLQPCNDIGELDDGALVFCPKGHGLVFWKPGTYTVTEIKESDGLLSNKVYALHIAADGVIWASTHKGLSKLSPLGGRRYRIENFTVKHGLPSNTINDVTTAAGAVWVASSKGLFRLQGRLPAVPIPAPLFARVLVNNTPYPLVALKELPHDSANLVIEFFSLHFRSGGDIKYRFRLLKPDADTFWTPTQQRRVFFPDLPPAAYRFEVQAQGENGQWSPVSTLAFTIRPPWYATWWARSLFALALGLLGYGIYRYRTNQIRTESRLKEEMHRLEGAALQAQMNPHFIFNCLNSIQNFILENDSDAAVLYLAKFAKLVRSALQVSVAGQVSLEEEIRMLDNYLALEKLRFKQIFEYDIEVDESLDRAGTLLPPLIVQPFVENAVLHGMKGKEKDGHIWVSFQREDGYLHITVQDDGGGLHPTVTAAGKASLGRSITRRRLELLEQQNKHAAITVKYLAGEIGTGVQIRLPLTGS